MEAGQRRLPLLGLLRELTRLAFRAGWGRNQETVSEDPLLSGTYGAEFSLGMQYDRPSVDRTPAPATPSAAEFMAVATPKHVLGYSLEQWSPDGNWSERVYTRLMFDSLITPCAHDMSHLLLPQLCLI